MSHNNSPSGARRFGYFLAIIINAAMIYAANNLLKWNIPFLTQSFQECLWAINLSLSISMFINFTFLFFDRKWFRSFMQALSNIFAAISVYTFRQIFPLDLTENLAGIVNFALVILIGLLLLSVLIEFVNAIRNYQRER